MYIYLIESLKDYETVYKIGYSRNSPIKRVKQLQTGNEGDLKVIRQFETEHGPKIEKALHNMFSHKKIKNEWFNLDNEDIVNFIEKCKKIEKNINFILNN